MVRRDKLEFEGAAFTQYVVENDVASFAVVPEKGGMIVSMKLRGEEFSWLRKNNFGRAERPRCGVPVLFPCCGVADNGLHEFNGKSYPMENHGFADLLPWQVSAIGESDITLRLFASAMTKFLYPFDFLLTVTYSLNKNTISIKTTVENTGDSDLPFSFGFHPYFACSGIENLDFDITAEICTDNAKKRDTPAPQKIIFPYDSDQTTRMLRGVKSPMRFSDSGNGHKVEIAFDSYFKNAILWQQGSESFVAVEPWNGWANSVNETGEHEILAPKKSLTASCSFTLEKA